MKSWKTIPFALSVLVIQAQAPPTTDYTISNQIPAPAAPSSSTSYYRVTVVQGSAKAINYQNLKSSTKIDFKGTTLLPGASGMAKVKNQDAGISIAAKFKDMPPASTFGSEFLTYVVWGISPEGRATNLGELILKNGHGKIKATEPIRTFGLVVTAEPYFAASQPSNVVVLENAIRQGTTDQVEFIDAKYELLQRGQYVLNLTSAEPMVMDEKTPFDVYQARNAVRIARAAGASTYAPEAFTKAEDNLKQSEDEGRGKKGRIMMARESVQRAEDSRLIAVQKQQVAQAAMERKEAQDKVDEANAQAAVAAAAQDAALKDTERADNENDSLRSKNQGLRSKNDGLESKNAGLRTELMGQLNAILQTRATARGLIVNMSGMLFQNGKSKLLPAAREKLSKIAGILATHKGLKIQAEGFTDSTGSDELNQRLSEERARNTKDYLVSQGVPAESISYKGFGKDSPIASNDTNAGRQENRRVELVVSGEGVTAAEDSSL